MRRGASGLVGDRARHVPESGRRRNRYLAGIRPTDHAISRTAIDEAAAAIRAGRLVAVPTETVYGLAADATNPRAVAAIFAAKGRPSFNPLIVHVASFAEARRLANFGDTGEILADAFWPGPLTIVVPSLAESGIAELATAGLPTIAIRVPSHPAMRELLEAAGRPLAAPSANLSGRVSATSAAHVRADFGDRVAIVLDAGPSELGLESTILSIAGPPTLLRPGAIAVEEIERVLGQSVGVAAPGHAVSAPGMLTSHYAPSVPLRLNAESVASGESLLAFGGRHIAGAEGAASVVNLSPGGDLAEAASRLFAALRQLDAVGVPIAVVPIPEHGLGAAINDRLRRATAPRA